MDRAPGIPAANPHRTGTLCGHAHVDRIPFHDALFRDNADRVLRQLRHLRPRGLAILRHPLRLWPELDRPEDQPDLPDPQTVGTAEGTADLVVRLRDAANPLASLGSEGLPGHPLAFAEDDLCAVGALTVKRSEERRVGKECRL